LVIASAGEFGGIARPVGAGVSGQGPGKVALMR
jgi:hypothetical protein